MRRIGAVLMIVWGLGNPAGASADVVLDWNRIAVSTLLSQVPGVTPFAQARFMAITQLAVFEAVNAVTGQHEPYLGTIIAPAGASADAAAIAAAHTVLAHYFPGSAATLSAARAASLAAIADGQAKSDGITVGEAAGHAMVALRAADGSSPPEFYVPGSTVAGEWQATPGCPVIAGVASGAFLHWGKVTPFGIPSAADFLLGPPPALTSATYAKDYEEVKRVGSTTSTPGDRPKDRADVARFYAVTSPSDLLNSAARQVSVAQGRSMPHNAYALALLNMAANDALVVSFATKYHYTLWRPETAIRMGTTDGNPKTEQDLTFVPFIATPCFPSYPSNHGSASGAGAEVLRRMYGAAGHSITLSNPAAPGIVLHYTQFKRIADDVDDARVYGGIHFRFDQEAGGALGRDIATYIVKNQLRAKHP